MNSDGSSTRSISKPATNKSTRVRTIGVLVVLLLATGLSALHFFTPPTLSLREPAEFSTYSQGKQSDAKLKLAKDSHHYQLIQSWLSQRRSWTPDINGYVPGDMIASDSVQINVQGNRVIVNIVSMSSRRWTQYSCPSDAEIMRLVKELRDQLAAQESQGESDSTSEPNREDE